MSFLVSRATCFILLGVMLPVYVSSAPGDLVSLELKEFVSVDQVRTVMQLAGAVSDELGQLNELGAADAGAVELHWVVESTDGRGHATNISGSLVLPLGVPPRNTVMFWWGTYVSDTGSPTWDTDGELLLCSLQAMVGEGLEGCSGVAILKTLLPSFFESVLVLPDYEGNGRIAPEDAPRLHPYHQSGTYERTMLNALDALAAANGQVFTLDDGRTVTVELHPDVVIGGYSLGGFASAASARGISSGAVALPEGFSVKGIAPMAGALDLEATFAQVMSSPDDYPRHYYIPFVVLGTLQEYGRFDLLPYVFAAPYDTTIKRLYEGPSSGDEITDAMPADITQIFLPGLWDALYQIWTERLAAAPHAEEREDIAAPGDIQAGPGLSPEAVANWMASATLHGNNLLLGGATWASTEMPVFLCHGKIDSQVPFFNSQEVLRIIEAANHNPDKIQTNFQESGDHTTEGLTCLTAFAIWQKGLQAPPTPAPTAPPPTAAPPTQVSTEATTTDPPPPTDAPTAASPPFLEETPTSSAGGCQASAFAFVAASILSLAACNNV